MGAASMDPLFTQEQAIEFIKRNKLKDAQSLEDSFIQQIKEFLHASLVGGPSGTRTPVGLFSHGTTSNKQEVE
jgi:hypothetical protein